MKSNEFIVNNFDLSDVECMAEQIECSRRFKGERYTTAYKGSRRPYSSTFRRNKKILRSAHPICSVCNTNKTEHIHHIDRNASNNTIENLLPVCRICHYSVFHPKIWKLFKWRHEQIA